MDCQDFEFSKKSTQYELNELENPELDPCEGVCPMEEIFVSLVEEWLELKGAAIIKEIVASRPKYTRQNAGLRDSKPKK